MNPIQTCIIGFKRRKQLIQQKSHVNFLSYSRKKPHQIKSFTTKLRIISLEIIIIKKEMSLSSFTDTGSRVKYLKATYTDTTILPVNLNNRPLKPEHMNIKPFFLRRNIR